MDVLLKNIYLPVHFEQAQACYEHLINEHGKEIFKEMFVQKHSRNVTSDDIGFKYTFYFDYDPLVTKTFGQTTLIIERA